jgi:hypothetical protein
MMVRACMIIDRLLPFSGFGLNLTRDDSGGLHMMARRSSSTSRTKGQVP